MDPVATEKKGHVRGSESEHEKPPFPLAELPEDCLAAALAHCSPLDLGRFACVSHNWQAAAQSEQAWPMIRKWKADFGAHFAALREVKSPPEIFQDLVKGITSDDGRFRLQADVASGKLTLQVSVVKNCGIIWLDETGETMYWAVREGISGSDFQTCAYLKAVCWFQISGSLSPPFPLPAGRYKVSWSVAKWRQGFQGFQWSDVPARCSVVLPGDNKVIDEVPIEFRRPGRPKSAKGPASPGLAPAPAARRRGGNDTSPVARAARPRSFTRWLQRTVGWQHGVEEESEEDEAWGDAQTEEEGGEEGSVSEAQIWPSRPLCWELFDAGVIELSPDELGSARLEARIDLREVTSGWWKSGMFFDSIHLTPC